MKYMQKLFFHKNKRIYYKFIISIVKNYSKKIKHATVRTSFGSGVGVQY